LGASGVQTHLARVIPAPLWRKSRPREEISSAAKALKYYALLLGIGAFFVGKFGK
jgi:hypothetical protein